MRRVNNVIAREKSPHPHHPKARYEEQAVTKPIFGF